MLTIQQRTCVSKGTLTILQRNFCGGEGRIPMHNVGNCVIVFRDNFPAVYNNYVYYIVLLIGYLLPQRFQKALKCQQESKKELELMMDNAAGF